MNHLDPQQEPNGWTTFAFVLFIAGFALAFDCGVNNTRQALYEGRLKSVERQLDLIQERKP